MKKKLNNHGLTLIEILISVSLIATVVLFLFNLLIDVRYNTEYSSMAKKNMVNRTSIVKAVEQDFIDKGVDLKKIGDFNNGVLIIPFLDNTEKRLEVNEEYIRYDNKKWIISKDNDFTMYDVDGISVNVSDKSCQIIFNADTNYDGECDKNCDINGDGLLNENDTFVDLNYQSCSKYQTLKIVVPVKTSSDQNIIGDDLEFYYIGEYVE